ncbi:hypothetical protein C4561_04805 [candidate division WWE3 bacterium]|jgi:hypothetical protein|uniref:Uncharacterized protein n=1 Tax=candidate division WWE3 bacterium TaxID=2053526 RepID=A0A3A4ZBI3_UNCKA|nr:MAG: hypothetical protein C4561_04805 [candidate division WWE3 bacterium]
MIRTRWNRVGGLLGKHAGGVVPHASCGGPVRRIGDFDLFWGCFMEISIHSSYALRILLVFAGFLKGFEGFFTAFSLICRQSLYMR